MPECFLVNVDGSKSSGFSIYQAGMPFLPIFIDGIWHKTRNGSQFIRLNQQIRLEFRNVIDELVLVLFLSLREKDMKLFW